MIWGRMPLHERRARVLQAFNDLQGKYGELVESRLKFQEDLIVAEVCLRRLWCPGERTDPLWCPWCLRPQEEKMKLSKALLELKLEHNQLQELCVRVPHPLDCGVTAAAAAAAGWMICFLFVAPWCSVDSHERSMQDREGVEATAVARAQEDAARQEGLEEKVDELQVVVPGCTRNTAVHVTACALCVRVCLCDTDGVR